MCPGPCPSWNSATSGLSAVWRFCLPSNREGIVGYQGRMMQRTSFVCSLPRRTFALLLKTSQPSLESFLPYSTWAMSTSRSMRYKMEKIDLNCYCNYCYYYCYCTGFDLLFYVALQADGQEVASVVSAQEIRVVAELLQISPEGLQKAITYKVTVSIKLGAISLSLYLPISVPPPIHPSSPSSAGDNEREDLHAADC